MSHLKVTEAQVALMLLTRLPAGRIKGKAPSTAEAAWAFPLVGALVGLLSFVAFWIATWLGLPPLAAAFLAMAASAFLTGALHEDGLADLADGFGGGRDKATKLAIMRDSRLGSYGAVALIFVLVLTATGIAETGSLALFVAIGALSRTAMLLPMAVLPPARSDGLGHAAALTIDSRVIVAFAVTAALVLVAVAFWPLIAAVAATFAVLALAKRQIGGQTGDVLGATQKLAECAAWLAATAAI